MTGNAQNYGTTKRVLWASLSLTCFAYPILLFYLKHEEIIKPVLKPEQMTLASVAAWCFALGLAGSSVLLGMLLENQSVDERARFRHYLIQLGVLDMICIVGMLFGFLSADLVQASGIFLLSLIAKSFMFPRD